MKKQIFLTLLFLLGTIPLFASDIDLKLPDLEVRLPHFFNFTVQQVLQCSSLIVFFTFLISMKLKKEVFDLVAHHSFLRISDIIYQNCKAYLIQQIKYMGLLIIPLVGAIIYYLKLSGIIEDSFQILFFTFMGVFGSILVAWYGMRLNTIANSRTAHASLTGNAFQVGNIPLKSGMSIGLFLISIELIMMVSILLFVQEDRVGICYLGFAIGESLGAMALRTAGGIFTKIADIGSDLMKIFCKIPEDDPRNPGVIADCVGDNAGDSVGPTADGFETYGVTGVALISFIVLAQHNPETQAQMLGWIFFTRFVMDFCSGVSYYILQYIYKRRYAKSNRIDVEKMLSNLLRLAGITGIIVTLSTSDLFLGQVSGGFGNKSASFVCLGILASLLIPEFVKVFTSHKSIHVNEIVKASRQGGASLNILSGMVAGYFSAFWLGSLLVFLMAIPIYTVQTGGFEDMSYPIIYAYGLFAFGLLCMGPNTIAVDSYGPVTDNAQSVFELSQIEKIPGIKKQIEQDFGFTPDFKKAKELLEIGDTVGNTFKATAKPVLIATAVTGATTMIFSIILLLDKLGTLDIQLTNPDVLLGILTGGCIIFLFSGASIQAVTTGAYKAVIFIKNNIRLNDSEAMDKDSKEVVKICTQYAQKGSIKIFGFLFSFTIGLALFAGGNFFVSYLISMSVFGLFMAIFMANMGGAWDNAKKVVETILKEKNTPLHDAVVVGDTVGDPNKDTSSVSINPTIKFSTLFGLLAVEIRILMENLGLLNVAQVVGVVFILIGFYFAHRSFYGMLIPEESLAENSIPQTSSVAIHSQVFAGK